MRTTMTNTMRAVALALLAGAVLSGCNGRDTFYDARSGEVFEAYGTAYDCRIASSKYGAQNVWRGLAGGRLHIAPGESRNISREACFPSEAECQYWSAQMDGAITRIVTNSCTRGWRG